MALQRKMDMDSDYNAEMITHPACEKMDFFAKLPSCLKSPLRVYIACTCTHPANRYIHQDKKTCSKIIFKAPICYRTLHIINTLRPLKTHRPRSGIVLHTSIFNCLPHPQLRRLFFLCNRRLKLNRKAQYTPPYNYSVRYIACVPNACTFSLTPLFFAPIIHKKTRAT